MKDFGRRLPVNVFIVFKGLNHAFVTGHRSQNAQLNLRIVRIRKNISILRHKYLPDRASLLRAHRDILQVGICRTDSSGRCNRLMEGRMNSGIRRNISGKSVCIRRFELCQRAVLQHMRHNRIIRRELFENIRRSRISGFGLFSPRQKHLLKKDLSELSGTCNIEFTAGFFLNLLFQLRDSAFQLLPVFPEFVRKHPDTGLLHVIQNIGERKFHVRIELPHAGIFELFTDLSACAQKAPRGPARVLRSFLYSLRAIGKPLLKGSFPKELLLRGNCLLQILRSNVLRLIITLQRVDEITSDQRVKHAGKPDTVVKLFIPNFKERKQLFNMINIDRQASPAGRNAERAEPVFHYFRSTPGQIMRFLPESDCRAEKDRILRKLRLIINRKQADAIRIFRLPENNAGLRRIFDYIK